MTLPENIADFFKNNAVRFRLRAWTGGLATVLGLILTNELSVRASNKQLYFGIGDDGTGKATELVQVGWDKADATATTLSFTQINDRVTAEITLARTNEQANATAAANAMTTAESKQAPATTLLGYGITDAYTKVDSDARLASTINGIHPEQIATLTALTAALASKENLDAAGALTAVASENSS
jgi:hypothetical protein